MKRKKVKTRLFTYWKGYCDKWRKHKILIISPEIQGDPSVILKNGLEDINRPKFYLRNVAVVVFTIVFVTGFYICSETFIRKYFILVDVSRKNHFHGFYHVRWQQ